MTPSTMLIVDDEEFIRLNLKRIFAEENHRLLLAANGSDAVSIAGKEEIDLVLLDLNLPDMSGLEILKTLKEKQPDLLVIIMTGFASVESAVEAIKLGAYDYIKKPFKADAIKLIVRLALERKALQQQVDDLKQQNKSDVSSSDILAMSATMRRVKEQVAEFARYENETVLITGESGTGKGLIAQVLHNSSDRSAHSFVKINCASIPETLLESELFGYEKGAFTDARTRKPGLFAEADKGSLFLDEIGEMSMALQAKLLHVLETKKFRPLGSTQDQESNVRIIAATNKNLKEAIINKEFRDDLYYRLNVLRIDLPPLRDRREDIIPLAQRHLERARQRFRKEITGFSSETEKFLLEYNWPGNIRELINLIERICILQKQAVIEPYHLPSELLESAFESSEAEEINLEDGFDLDEYLREKEFQVLQKAFILSGKNTSRTARMLHIPRETLRYKLEKLGIMGG
jgi:two-component system response regulator AtoC